MNEKCKDCKHDPQNDVEWHEFCFPCIYEDCIEEEDNFEPKEVRK